MMMMMRVATRAVLEPRFPNGDPWPFLKCVTLRTPAGVASEVWCGLLPHEGGWRTQSNAFVGAGQRTALPRKSVQSKAAAFTERARPRWVEATAPIHPNSSVGAMTSASYAFALGVGVALAAQAALRLARAYRRRSKGQGYTSLDAAEDDEVVGAVRAEAYEGTRIAAARHNYCVAHSTPTSATLERITAQTQARLCLPQMLSGAISAHFLQLVIRASRAKRVLEVGTYTGYTAVAMAEALPPHGRLVCVDNFSDEPAAEAICREALFGGDLASKVELVVDCGENALRSLADAKCEPFDVVFIDADKAGQVRYLDRLLDSSFPLVHQASTIIVDNTLWYSRPLRPPSRHDQTTAAVAAFNAHVLRDPRVRVAMLPIRDGLTVLQPSEHFGK